MTAGQTPAADEDHEPVYRWDIFIFSSPVVTEQVDMAEKTHVKKLTSE